MMYYIYCSWIDMLTSQPYPLPVIMNILVIIIHTIAVYDVVYDLSTSTIYFSLHVYQVMERKVGSMVLMVLMGLMVQSTYA